MLHAGLIEIVYIVMPVVDMHSKHFTLGSMLCAHQEATMSQEIGTQNGWAIVSDASTKTVQ